MKNLIKIVFLFFGLSSFSQTIVEKSIETTFDPDVNKHVYMKDVNSKLNKYEGIWVFNDGTHYFKIQFYKQTYHRETPEGNKKITIFADRIVGHYQYKLNGVEIYNVTDNLYAYSNFCAFYNGFSIYFNEPSANTCGRRIRGDVSLTYSNNNGIEQLTWNRENFDGAPYCYPFDATPYKTPATMVLTKQ